VIPAASPKLPAASVDIWYTLGDVLQINTRHYRTLSQSTLPFGAFVCKYMAGKSMASLNFARTSLFEAFGRTPVSFDLWHISLHSCSS
jgi:hypothetical protein